MASQIPSAAARSLLLTCCWARRGIDYIKVDSCGGADPAQYNTTHPLLSSWFLQEAKAASRPVLYHPS